MFVPIRTDPNRLTAARSGEFGKGLPSRPFSASAGAASLVTKLVSSCPRTQSLVMIRLARRTILFGPIISARAVDAQHQNDNADGF